MSRVMDRVGTKSKVIVGSTVSGSSQRPPKYRSMRGRIYGTAKKRMRRR